MFREGEELVSRKASSTDRGTESMHHAVTPSPPATISLKAGPALGLIYDMLAEMCHDLERWFGTVETAASEDPDFLQLVARATLFLEENGGEVPD